MIKRFSSMFIGAPPELEMALYTLCIVMNKKMCRVSLGGTSFMIRAHAFNRGLNKLVASAYPVL